MKMFCLRFALFVLPLNFWGQNNKTEVLLCSTIHSAHTQNPHYSYENLFSYAEKYNPDVIGVEIRENDIDSSTNYLKKFYPYEMYESIRRFKNKKIVGFDWLGDELNGKAIPENYWTELSSIKKLQRKLNTDSLITKKLEPLQFISKKKNDLALTASLQEMNDGRYDALNEVYYEQMDYFLKNTAYYELVEFYKRRDVEIAHNIMTLVKANPGKKILFLMGADHRSYSLKQLKKHLGKSIIIQDVR